jgi:hypothetical protein
MRSTIASDYPIMKRVPAFDDPRPFVTSWNSIKQWIDNKRSQPE